MTTLRQDALRIWNAGVDSVRARSLVASRLRIESGSLILGDDEQFFFREDYDRLLIVGAGKAGTAMAEGLVDVIGDWLPFSGWVNVPEGTVAGEGSDSQDIDREPYFGKLQKIRFHAARPAASNEPTLDGVYGTEKILELVGQANKRDLCITLISGGGSALLPAPRESISLDDKLAVIRQLSATGANIAQLNTVRKHLSRVKGGGLLRACRAGTLLTLVLSDVLGDPIDLIASGPTVQDQSTAEDALTVLSQFDPQQDLPQSVYQLLRSDKQVKPAATTKSFTFVIGNNALAVDEAGIQAERLGYNHVMQSANACEGIAEEIGRKHAEILVSMLRDQNQQRPNCYISGGEPVVRLAPVEIRGLGGRNQQLVLAAYQYLREQNLSRDQWDRIALLSGGTDGEDGPTDAAGAIVDAAVHESAQSKGLDVGDFLRRNDAYHFFSLAGGLIQTGPTGTNVCDLRVGVIQK